eukprot:11182299-Alexandrium_andersonii.AAC.1
MLSCSAAGVGGSGTALASGPAAGPACPAWGSGRVGGSGPASASMPGGSCPWYGRGCGGRPSTA